MTRRRQLRTMIGLSPVITQAPEAPSSVAICRIVPVSGARRTRESGIELRSEIFDSRGRVRESLVIELLEERRYEELLGLLRHAEAVCPESDEIRRSIAVLDSFLQGRLKLAS